MKKKNIIELIAIYIILTALSYAFYLVLVAVEANDAVASALLSWSATMFATIALLYTFNSWREQKGSEFIAKEAEDTIKLLLKNIYYIELLFNYIELNSATDEERNDILINLQNDNSDILRKALFINSCIKIDGFQENLELIMDKKIKILQFFNDSKFNNTLNNMEDIRTTKSDYGKDAFKLINALKPYSLYQKTPTFRKNSEIT